MRPLHHILEERGLRANDARRALESGKVFVQGIPTAYAGRLVDPAHVEVRVSAPRLTPGRDLVLVHVDDDLAVVWKPAGMLSVVAPRRRGARTVIGEAARLLGGALPVHRLDEDTSGLMLVARHPEAQLAAKHALAEHEVERRYLAVAHGVVAPDETRIESFLVRDRGDGLRGSGDPNHGRRSVTWIRGIENPLRNTTLVEARLETGRTHQVRIHLAESGHPVLGDALYGSQGTARLAPRLALHAAILGFVHPRTQARMRFASPLPDDLSRWISASSRPRPP